MSKAQKPKVGQRPVQRPPQKATAKPVVNKPANKPVAKPAAKAAPQKPAQKPVQKPVQKPAAKGAPPAPNRSPAPLELARLQGNRRKVFADLDEAQQAFCQKLHRIVSVGSAGALLTIYRLGYEVRQAKDQAKYGDGLMKRIAFATFGSEKAYSRLMSARKIADVYTEEELKLLIAQATENGHELTASHLKYLVGLTGPNESKRKRLEQEIVTKGLSADQLSAKTRKAPAGKPPTPVVGLARFSRMAEAFVAQRDVFEENVLHPLEQLDDEQLTSETVAIAEQALRNLSAQTKFISTARERLQALLSRANPEPDPEANSTGEDTEEAEELDEGEELVDDAPASGDDPNWVEDEDETGIGDPEIDPEAEDDDAEFGVATPVTSAGDFDEDDERNADR